MLFNFDLLLDEHNQKFWTWILWILIHCVLAKCQHIELQLITIILKDHGRNFADKVRKHSLSILWPDTWLKFEAKLHFPMAKNTQSEYSWRYTIIPTSTCVCRLINYFRIRFPQLIYSQYSTRFFIFFSEENFWFFFPKISTFLKIILLVSNWPKYYNIQIQPLEIFIPSHFLSQGERAPTLVPWPSSALIAAT
jgi:hypothetical protein